MQFLGYRFLAFSVSVLLLCLSGRTQSQGGWSWEQAEVDADYIGAGYASDPSRRKIYRFGGKRGIGLSDETWEFDGLKWRQLHPVHSPPPLVAPMMSFDPVTKRILLFGGVLAVEDRYGITIPSRLSARTWAWDGMDWKELFPKTSPSPRLGFSAWMASDPVARRVVLHGGLKPGALMPVPFDDTWAWDGANWTEIKSKKRPSLRNGYSMAFHAGSGRVVLFGGAPYPRGPYLNDMWVLVGTEWQPQSIPSTATPSPRIWGAFHSDFITKEALLFGGISYEGKTIYHDDLWSWNGKKWKKLGSGYGKTWQYPTLRHIDAIGPHLYLDVMYYPGKIETTLRRTRTFRWKRPGWKEVTRFVDHPFLRGYYSRIASHPDSGEVLRFSVEHKPASKQFPYGWGVEVFRLEGDQFQPVPVTGVKPHYTTWTMPHPYFDAVVRKIRFFAGHVSQKDYGLWTFEGSKWSFQSLASDKTRLAFHVTWDPVRSKPVVVQDYKFYSFDGKKWVVEFMDKAGPWRGRVVYDFRRKAHVLIQSWSGTNFSGPARTWELSGKTWKRIQTSKAPPPSGYDRLYVYVPELGGIVFAGGQGPVRKKALSGTWLYDSKGWSLLPVAKLPQRRVEDRMSNLVYDAARKRVLAFYPKHHPHMFELRKRTLRRSQPLVRRGESTTFDVAMPQQRGRPFLLGLSLSRKRGIPIGKDPVFGTQLFPLDHDSMLAWSLSGPIFTMLDATGRGKIAFRIPKSPSIPEIDIWASGFTLDLAKRKVGEVSNSIPLQIVR